MAPEQQLTFGPFRLAVTDGRLWRGAHVVALRPRAIAVLRYLVEHPGRLVTKAELRQHVWGDMRCARVMGSGGRRRPRGATLCRRHSISKLLARRGTGFSEGAI